MGFAINAAIYIVVVGSVLGAPVLLQMRKKKALREAPPGSRRTVDVKPPAVNKAILQWGKLGYDLLDRDEFQGRPTGRSRLQPEHVVLTFIKR